MQAVANQAYYKPLAACLMSLHPNLFIIIRVYLWKVWVISETVSCKFRRPTAITQRSTSPQLLFWYSSTQQVQQSTGPWTLKRVVMGCPTHHESFSFFWNTLGGGGIWRQNVTNIEHSALVASCLKSIYALPISAKKHARIPPGS